MTLPQVQQDPDVPAEHEKVELQPTDEVGVLGRVLAVPLLPFVLVWDAFKAFWTSGLPALGRLARKGLQPLAAAGRFVHKVARAFAARVGVTVRAVARLVRGLALAVT